MTEREFELLLVTPTGTRKIVTWTGITGDGAARRYMDCAGKPGEKIIATRTPPIGVYVYGNQPIID